MSGKDFGGTKIGGYIVPGPGVPLAPEDLVRRPVVAFTGHLLGQEEARGVSAVLLDAEQSVHDPRRAGQLQLRQENVSDTRLGHFLGARDNRAQLPHCCLVNHLRRNLLGERG
jgi:hypothetical protein